MHNQGSSEYGTAQVPKDQGYIVSVGESTLTDSRRYRADSPLTPHLFAYRQLSTVTGNAGLAGEHAQQSTANNPEANQRVRGSSPLAHKLAGQRPIGR